MIYIRLPWRPRARPSATLHEIPICSMKSKLQKKTTTDQAVCQVRFHCRRGAEEIVPAVGCSFFAVHSNNLESRFARHTHGFKPAADKYLGVSFTTIMARGCAHGGSQIPLDDGELLISTLDHKPMNRILTDDPANLALKFLETRHAYSGEP